MPAERVAALRKAFDAMVRDPAFLEEARKENFDIDPVSGEAMQKLVAEIVAMPKAQGETAEEDYRVTGCAAQTAASAMTDPPVWRTECRA